MKIESNPKIFTAADPLPKTNNNTPPSRPFGQVLAETVKSGVPSKSEVTGPQTMPAISPLQLELARNSVNRSEVVSKLEQLLDVLDQYRLNLENQRISLRDIAPLTHQMETKLNELAPELEKLDQQDPLSPILNETLITVTMEVRKFGNGWYNPA